MMRRSLSGFTLIELTIVVAIISILSAIAIPLYADYQQRSKLVSAVAGIASYKSAVAQCIQDSGAKFGCDLGINGIPGPIDANVNPINYVTAVDVVNGEISVITTATAADSTSLELLFSPDWEDGKPSVNWKITGSGCTEPGRSIKCYGL
jgi:type IV pilus assembly protein PilA